MASFRVAGGLVLALTAPWACTTIAHADPSAQLGRVPVVTSPTCGGSVSAEAQVVPVQIGDRLGDGVRVAIHYGYANATFATGSGAVIVTLSSHPGEEMRITA
ncbi:hypothetical protein AU193_18135 [Mycobacterium sp. GA-1285]|uniref:hypothetical protein n=1 Tax=Mycobacterium sp. GA-1285 TaxID=1772282 RepID=UPI00074A745B|nr:hypothetical protein [Mycobacterium sp. GA-1285]KUI22182.1 hypothetical protein AU193_18135 [Mycobacterium sp. GA-1285]